MGGRIINLGGRLGGFEGAALGEQSTSTSPIMPEVASPAQQIQKTFAIQSYFDTTKLEKAILEQNRNEPIVKSTLSPVQAQGYAVGLHPSSETPVAIKFTIGGQKSSSAVVVLKPGQFIRPHGVVPGMKSGAFSGFEWGLPFGWLGGGLANLFVFQTPDAKVAWTEHKEILFHRFAWQIKSAAGEGAGPFPNAYNWPMRFPWPHAIRSSTNNIDQSGNPAISVRPTRTLIALRLTALAAAATMRVLWVGSEFGTDSAGAVVATEAVWTEIMWPTYASMAVAGISDYPVQELAGVMAGLAANDGQILIDSGDASLQNAYVQIARYGQL